MHVSPRSRETHPHTLFTSLPNVQASLLHSDLAIWGGKCHLLEGHPSPHQDK